MDRRDLLKLGLAGGICLGSPLGDAARSASNADGPRGGGAPAPGPAEVDAFAFGEMGVAELQAGMDRGTWRSAELVAAFLDRIEAVDRGGPALRAVVEINPDALDIARGLDEERRRNGARGPMHGIPVLVKDNLDTADRMQTTAGSLALEGPAAPADAFAVRRLREAGAVILGKTNLSEWANIRSSFSSSGWSARGGQTRNPYVLDRSPCGSSSGSGVAVAANLCTVAVGTETDGSVTCPAAINGIVGIKPTLGLVSRRGIVPIAASQDTAGPMARTVRDAALLLNALAGPDPADPASAAFRKAGERDYTRTLDPGGLKGARVGVARNLFGYHEALDARIADCLDALRGAGAVLVDPADLPHAHDYGAAELEVLLYELKAGLNAYLAARPGAPVKSLAEVIAFNERHRSREMPYFGQDLLVKAEGKGPLSSPVYRAALQRCRRLSRAFGIDAVLRKHRLDAVVAPTTGPAWPIDLLNGDHFTGSATTPPAVAGYPHVTVPAGLVRDLPVGLSFIGTAFSEPVLLRLAYAFEQTVKARRPPRFLPTLSLGPAAR
ncbi:MAG: amidase [Acidobacteria bacterium]|nr:amidase [Acidobacteriota bacterium]